MLYNQFPHLFRCISMSMTTISIDIISNNCRTCKHLHSPIPARVVSFSPFLRYHIISFCPTYPTSFVLTNVLPSYHSYTQSIVELSLHLLDNLKLPTSIKSIPYRSIYIPTLPNLCTFLSPSLFYVLFQSMLFLVQFVDHVS